MSYPNSDLSPWTILLMAVVVIASLAAWLILVYRAAREPRRQTVANAREVRAVELVGPGSGRAVSDEREVDSGRIGAEVLPLLHGRAA